MSYVSKPEQFEEVKKEFIPKYNKYLATVISQRMELRNLATKEEWEKISKITKTYVPPKDYREN